MRSPNYSCCLHTIYYVIYSTIYFHSIVLLYYIYRVPVGGIVITVLGRYPPNIYAYTYMLLQPKNPIYIYSLYMYISIWEYVLINMATVLGRYSRLGPTHT